VDSSETMMVLPVIPVQTTDDMEVQEDAASGKQKRDSKKFFKTELCRFFPKCAKGEQCPYAHSDTELNVRPDLQKTTLCADWRKGKCPFDSATCKFAHGRWELRAAAFGPAEARAGTEESAGQARRRRTRGGKNKTGGGMSRQLSSESQDSDTATQAPSLASGVWSRQVTIEEDFDDCLSIAQGMSRQVSIEPSEVGSLMPGSSSRPATETLDSLPSMSCWSRQVSTEDSLPNLCWSRQQTTEETPSARSRSKQAITASLYDLLEEPGHWTAPAPPVDKKRQEEEVLDQIGRARLKQLDTQAEAKAPEPAEGTLQMPVMIDVGTERVLALATISLLSPAAVFASKAMIEKALRAAMPDIYED
jgi:hypothetical protein